MQEMTETFTCDYIQFSERGEFFDPLSDTALTTITVDLSLSSHLDWKVPKEEKKILWNLDFNLESISFYNQITLSSFLVAIRTFIEKLYLPLQKQTFAVCLYQGPILFPFKWNVEHEEAFAAWREGVPSFPNAKDLYCAEILSEYLHRLAAALPDEALPIVFFDPIKGAFARMAQLLSREHFSYLFVGVKDPSFPLPPFHKKAAEATIGVTLPLHAYCSEKSLKQVDACLEELKGMVRIVTEAYLTESWDGLDTLILFSGCVSPQGKRKAQGFIAAGGQLVVQGSPLGISGEISWSEFRGRGI